MSWFSDIAEKAEDLLNRVDKTAATALQGKQKSVYLSTSTVVSSEVPYTSYTPAVAQQSLDLRASSSFRSSPLHSSSAGIKPAKKVLPAQNKVESDEKLMEFLNSCEPVASVPGSKAIQTHEKEDILLHNEQIPVSGECAVSQDMSKAAESASKTEENVQTFETPSGSNDGPASHTAISMEGKSFPDSFEEKGAEVTRWSSEDTHESLPSSSEILPLKEELLLAVKRAEHAEAEMRRMQKKLDHWNSQISGNDRHVRELQEREADLLAAIDAKDSQLAVLKVRLQETDQELLSKKIIIEDLKSQNERIIREQVDAGSCQNQLLDDLRQKLQQTEAELSREKESYFALQTEHMQRMSKMEEEQKHLAENFANLQRKWSEVKEKNKELSSQLKTTNVSLENLHQDYLDYKQKAQRVLQSKEKLIMSLKDCNGDVEHQDAKEGTYALLLAETEEIKQERDVLREELRRSIEMIESYKAEIQEVEKMAQNDSNTAREHLRNLEEQFNQEKLYKEELELLNNQLKDELKFLREDLSRTKVNFQSRIQDRDTEIEKLRRQLMAKSLSTSSQDELESRLHALTENLIQKQTVLEALSTEKNSLVLQLERLEQQLKEMQLYGSQHHTVVGVSNSEPDRKFKQTVFADNPFDNSLTRRVKRMYGSIDAFSIRLGIFFRRYPVARVFVMVYMLLLHLWVMVVLLTYQPEIHN